MGNRREMLSRILRCRQAGVPVTNYGLTIAYSLGILERALGPFPAALEAFRESRTSRNGPARRGDDVIDRAEVLAWLRETDPSRLSRLYRRADAVRREHVGDEVHLRGLVEVSNHCVRRCAYCGISPRRTTGFPATG